MTFLILIITLSIEHFRPLCHRQMSAVLLSQIIDIIEYISKNSSTHTAFFKWGMITIPLTIMTLLTLTIMSYVSKWLGFIGQVLVLYLLVSPQRLISFYRDLYETIEQQDYIKAASLLAEESTFGMKYLIKIPPKEDVLLMKALELGFLRMHLQVFSTILIFSFFGCSGAVFYRLCGFAASQWPKETGYQFLSGNIFYFLDWPLVRLTAALYLICGNFEGGRWSWYQHSKLYTNLNEGVLASTGGGAMGVRLYPSSYLLADPDNNIIPMHRDGIEFPRLKHLYSLIDLNIRVLIAQLIVLLFLAL